MSKFAITVLGFIFLLQLLQPEAFSAGRSCTEALSVNLDSNLIQHDDADLGFRLISEQMRKFVEEIQTQFKNSGRSSEGSGAGSLDYSFYSHAPLVRELWHWATGRLNGGDLVMGPFQAKIRITYPGAGEATTFLKDKESQIRIQFGRYPWSSGDKSARLAARYADEAYQKLLINAESAGISSLLKDGNVRTTDLSDGDITYIFPFDNKNTGAEYLYLAQEFIRLFLLEHTSRISE